MILQILSHTPVWVWAVLALLLALGWTQTRERRVAPRRLLLLPLVLLGLGLWSMAPGFVAVPASAVSWLLALGTALALTRGQRPPVGARWLAAEQRLLLPGSWLPMGLILVIFSMRYVSNVGMALHPAWRNAPALLLPMAALYGALSGFFLGRALAQWRLAGGVVLPSARTGADAASAG
jgi:hypothetical protein